MKKKIILAAGLLAASYLAFVGLITFGTVEAKSVNFATFAEKSASVQKVETRCGWVANPTPGNWWLTDKDGTWTIGVQGGYQADGDVPEFPSSKWVETNGSYGYGCACLRVTVNRKKSQVTSIKGGTVKALSVCRKDPNLKEPKD